MRSTVKTYNYPNGEIQRLQLLTLDSWEELDFVKPCYTPDALDRFADVYRNFLVPACPWLFGHMVMFHLPEDLQVPFSRNTKAYGTVSQPLTAAAAALERGVRFRDGKPVFSDAATEGFWNALAARDCIRVVSGKLPITTPIPVGNGSGYLSRICPEARMKVNASFFIMDRFDCATVYDHLGTPFGLCVRNGTVLSPPLFRREALLVRQDGSVSIEAPDIRETDIVIGGKVFRHGQNAKIYTRPAHPRTPPSKLTKLVITGTEVAAVCSGALCRVPASGFVLCTGDASGIHTGDSVSYRGMEDVRFGIQVGNSTVREGVPTLRFVSRFYNIYHLQPVPFPPSLYPMSFRKARAARIALGADAQGHPMLMWAEGAAKLGYQPGESSRGATLEDMARFCVDAGMHNAVNLDGGGSAQILLQGRRLLKISDRCKETFAEAERPVPLGLIIR